MAENGSFSVTLKQLEDYQFQATFEGTDVDPILLDEPPPLGSYGGPSASRLLAASVGHCLSSSLLFCLQKARIEVDHVQTRVKGSIQRDDRRRLRVGSLDVAITISPGEAQPARLDRCLEIFEDFCVVTGSVRNGIEVNVKVVERGRKA